MTSQNHNRHRWGLPYRFYRDVSRDGHRDHMKTERECLRCGMIRVTRHEGRSHWVEFWRDSERLSMGEADATPSCDRRFEVQA